MTSPLIQNQGQLIAPSLAQPLYTKLGLKTDFAQQFANQAIANNAKSLVPNNPLSGIQQQTSPLKQSFTEKFQNSKWGQAAGIAGSVLAQSYDLIPTMDKVHNSNDQFAGDIRKNISSALMTSGNPYAMAAGFATMGIDKLGGFADASKGLGGGNDLLNTVSSIALPGAGWFASTTDKYTMSDTLAKSSSYTGAADKSKTAMQNAGANILFGFSRAQKMIREAKRKDNMIQGIINDAEDRTSAAGWYGNELRNWMDLNGGMERTHLARLGMKLPSKQDIAKVREILAKGGKIYSNKQTANFEFEDSIEAEFPEEIEVPEFKDGGQLNVIPEGALHARKNNMEGAGKDFTHKGIPVIDKDGEQQAEIERDEIIFRKEVTVKLEELMKDGSDKAAIEAGKLLVEEIFHNTDDRTGLIASIVGEEPELSEEEELLSKMQKGGKTYKHWKKPDNWTEDKIPYSEWIKDLPPSEYQGNYDLETAYKYYPKETLERWKWAVLRPTEDEYNYFMNYKDENGENIYHLGSIAEIPGTEDYIFLKKGREEDNEELHWETDGYRNGTNGMNKTHDLVFEGDRYYYRKKKTPKKAEGGTINKVFEELNKLSPEKLKEFQNILKYLNQ